jgi:tripartite-type tricarboxylate transporter receptor subunit TctC
MKTRKFAAVAMLSIVTFLLAGSHSAFAKEFYAGKTIRFIVGFAAGGGYDAYTRMVARYISRYVPGHPFNRG